MHSLPASLYISLLLLFLQLILHRFFLFNFFIHSVSFHFWYRGKNTEETMQIQTDFIRSQRDWPRPPGFKKYLPNLQWQAWRWREWQVVGVRHVLCLFGFKSWFLICSETLCPGLLVLTLCLVGKCWGMNQEWGLWSETWEQEVDWAKVDALASLQEASALLKVLALQREKVRD